MEARMIACFRSKRCFISTEFSRTVIHALKSDSCPEKEMTHDLAPGGYLDGDLQWLAT